MTYEDSIRTINETNNRYYAMRRAGIDENMPEILKTLETLFQLKAKHREEHGMLLRIDGEWI